MGNPYRYWTPAAIAEATGCKEAAVREHWPIIEAALERFGINDRPVQMAAIATVAIETASTFQPVREAFWLDEAWRQANLRYYPFYGRGYIQLTWESNYRKYGDALGIDLVNAPDRALEPLIAADNLARYFNEHGGGSLIPQAARGGDWREVRRLVQGGSAGLDRFTTIVRALQGASPMPSPPPYTYNRDEPAHPQEDSFDCSQEALEWALYALGRAPQENWLEPTMIAEGVMTPELGLMDASGAGLAAFVVRHYGSGPEPENTLKANNEPSITWDWIVHEGANPDGSSHAYPLLIGGRTWGTGGHWSGVRDFDPARGVLLLANPADGYTGIGQTMNQEEFEARGPWSAVRIWHDSLFAAPQPEPPVPTKPSDREVLAAVRRQLLETVEYIDAQIGG